MSNNKTQLGLNRWTASEKPLMAEFNSDNQIIDEKLRELSVNKAEVETIIKKPIAYTEGIRHYISGYYYKKLSGEVVIHMTFISPDAMIEHGRVIAVMPEGFRPAGRIEVFFWGRSHMGTILFEPNGNVIIYCNGGITKGTPCFMNTLVYPTTA